MTTSVYKQTNAGRTSISLREGNVSSTYLLSKMPRCGVYIPHCSRQPLPYLISLVGKVQWRLQSVIVISAQFTHIVEHTKRHSLQTLDFLAVPLSAFKLFLKWLFLLFSLFVSLPSRRRANISYLSSGHYQQECSYSQSTTQD